MHVISHVIPCNLKLKHAQTKMSSIALIFLSPTIRLNLASSRHAWLKILLSAYFKYWPENSFGLMAYIWFFSLFIYLFTVDILPLYLMIELSLSWFFSLIYCCNIYQPNFFIVNFISKYRQKYIIGIYRENHN
jgi:hypothetical protein